MSRRIRVEFLDDFDGKPAVVTRTVALDDKIVELDLSEASSTALDEMLSQAMAKGVPVKALHRAESLAEEPASPGRSDKREYNRQMRAWAELCGRGDEVKSMEHNGKNTGYSYSPELRRDFADFMHERGPVR